MIHTPVPWKIGFGYADYLAIEAYYEEDDAWWSIATIELDDHGAEPTDEQLANAYFIVTACNTHDTLLAAVEAMVQAYPYSDIVDGELCTCATCKAYRLGVAAIELTTKEGE